MEGDEEDCEREVVWKGREERYRTRAECEKWTSLSGRGDRQLRGKRKAGPVGE